MEQSYSVDILEVDEWSRVIVQTFWRCANGVSYSVDMLEVFEWSSVDMLVEEIEVQEYRF